MKKISSALIAFLMSTEAFNRADLIQVALPNGQIIYANSSTQDIVFQGNKYYSSLYGAWQLGTVTMEATFSPSPNQVDLTVFAQQSVVYPGTSTSLMATLIAGLFDGAMVTVYRIYWAIGSTPAVGIALGFLTFYVGQIGNIKQTGDTSVSFDVYDMTHLLNRLTPPNLVQSGCRHTLFDSNCTLAATSYQLANTIAANSTSLQLNLQTTITVTPYYLQGKLKFTSGQNSGLEFSIKSQGVTGGVPWVMLSSPTPFPPAFGDTLFMYPGCDKSVATCQGKFNNLINFGGEPYVPAPESAS
jgi:uncharacterized phage protein (TIGR02218 family)